MNRTSLGFVLAMLFNSAILLLSKGFSPDLGAVDPLFGPSGCVGILLWGLAYLALARSYTAAPAVALVFCLEKVFYAGHWALWLAGHSSELLPLIDSDPLTGLFFACYGAGDAGFALFFGWVAWTWRNNFWGRSANDQADRVG